MELTGNVTAEHVAHAALFLGVIEQVVFAVQVVQALVDVSAVARQISVGLSDR